MNFTRKFISINFHPKSFITMKKYLFLLIIPAVFILYRCTSSNKNTTNEVVNSFNITFNAVIPPDLVANATEQQLAGDLFGNLTKH